MEKILLKTDQFNGQYVALKSPNDASIIASGTTPTDALEEARKKGIQDPIIIYVPTEESVHIY